MEVFYHENVSKWSFDHSKTTGFQAKMLGNGALIMKKLGFQALKNADFKHENGDKVP